MKKSDIKINYIYNIIYQLLIVILPLITSPYIARTLGASGIGEYSYAYSIAHYFAIFIILGLSNYGNRTIASVRDNKKELSKCFCEIYIMQFLLGIIFSVLYILYICTFNVNNILVSSLMLIYVLSYVFDINWFFQGLELFKHTVIRNFVIKILTVIGIFVFVKDINDLWKYTLIMVLSYLITQIVLWPFVKEYVNFVKPSLKNILKHLKPNLVLFVPVIAINVYKYMDKIMLGAIINVTEVGYYENAEKIVTVALGFITAFGTVMLPRMSNMYANGNEKEAKKYLDTSFHFITIITIAIVCGLISVGKDFSIIFWGSDFEICGVLISLLALSMIFIAWPNVIRTQFLIPKHREKDYIVSVIIGAIVNFIINYILIYRLKSIGTAIGTVCAEMSVCIYQLWAIRKDFSVYSIIRKNSVFLFPGIIMICAISIMNKLINFGIIRLIVNIIIGAIIYIGIVLIIEYLFNKEEFEKIKKILKINKKENLV